MRITRDTLLKIARDTAQAQVQRNRRLVCVYLTGSLLTDEPLLGGTTDIDLIFVHDSEPLIDREITRLTDEVHLDIAHYSQAVFHQPRHLRADPWIGPFLCANPIPLHDSHHWFEFTQAAVCAQFQQPENVYQRAQVQAAQARQIWLDLHVSGAAGEPKPVLAYLQALELSANAIAAFSGLPLTERRLFLQFPQRAQAVERPGLAAGLVDLLIGETVPASEWQAWQPAWKDSLDAAGQLDDAAPRLTPVRKSYYTRAAAALWESDPAAAVWIAMRTWTLALNALGPEHPERVAWQSALQVLGLDAPRFPARLEQLDTFLDNIEEVVDSWAREYGIETNI